MRLGFRIVLTSPGRAGTLFRMKQLLFLAGVALAASLTSRAADPVPDFKLADVNRASPRYPSKVSPRDYLLQVSGYYFGEAG